MSKIIGNRVLIYVDEQAIGCTTGATLNITGELIETTCKDNDGARTVVTGSDSWTMDFSGNWETTSTYGTDELLGIKLNKTRVGVKMSVVDSAGSELSGGTYVTGYAYLSTLSIDTPLNSPAVVSGTFEGDGAWAYGTTT